MKIEVSAPVKCVRLYADSDGESHFEDGEIPFELKDFAPPAPPVSITDLWEGTGAFLMSSPPGWVGDLHPAPRRMLMFILRGVLEVEASDGEVRTFEPGPGALLVEDTSGKGHISRVTGDERGCLVAIPLS
jgi:hypothetical protein